MKEQKKDIIFFGDVGTVQITRLDEKTNQNDRVLMVCFKSNHAPTIIEILNLCERDDQLKQQNEKMIFAILKSFGIVDGLDMLIGSVAMSEKRMIVQLDALVSVPDFVDFKPSDPVVDVNNPKSIHNAINDLLNDTNISKQ